MLTVVNVEAERVSRTETRIDPNNKNEIDRDIAAIVVSFNCTVQFVLSSALGSTRLRLRFAY